MKKAGFYILFMMFSTMEVSIAAEEAVVIEVRKNIQMSKGDKIYKNYFINGGSALGLVKGKRVDVIRRLPVHDPIKNSSIGDLFVKVGSIEIIHSDKKISVARPLSFEKPEDRPILEYETVMIGDRLDLQSISDVHVAAVHIPSEEEIAGKLGEVVMSKVSRDVANIADYEAKVAAKNKKKPRKKTSKKAKR